MEDMYPVFEEFKGEWLSVITVQITNTREDKGRWIDYINEHQMYGWVNAWNPYTNAFRELYDLTSTPKLYLLDEKGNIVLKNIEAADVKKILDSEKAHK
jgi:hypothetical protein